MRENWICLKYFISISIARTNNVKCMANHESKFYNSQKTEECRLKIRLKIINSCLSIFSNKSVKQVFENQN